MSGAMIFTAYHLSSLGGNLLPYYNRSGVGHERRAAVVRRCLLPVGGSMLTTNAHSVLVDVALYSDVYRGRF